MTESSYQPLRREVEAIQIPAGTPARLPAGTEVLITQALGGTYTVVAADRPGLFRLRGEDADALGLEISAAPVDSDSVQDGTFSEELVWAQLRNCYDPEIPVNIVDLGLIYSLETSEDQSGRGKKVAVKMTLTAPGCGMGPSLAADAEQRIVTVPGVAQAVVELVWDPPWGPERISEEGRKKLGME